MTEFHKALDMIMELPPEDRRSLIDIVKRRMIEERRDEIANEAHEAISLYIAGKLKQQTADNAVKELESLLGEDEEP